MWEVRLFKRIVNCTKGVMPVSMFVIYRTIFIVFGSHKWASENSAKLDFPCCQIKGSAKKPLTKEPLPRFLNLPFLLLLRLIPVSARLLPEQQLQCRNQRIYRLR